ncbi:MAG TPA: response regulator [Anaerolineales bacterium]|nr:response regulator [Anaerolineales bacterium]
MLPSTQSKIRILLADDHRLVREQLAARLSREADFDIVGVAATSRATLQEMQLKHPHILLIDPIMRDGLGLAILRQVCANFPKLVIVILTAYVDTALNMHFQQMGIRHILTKGVVSSHLLTELRAAYTSADFQDSQET